MNIRKYNFFDFDEFFNEFNEICNVFDEDKTSDITNNPDMDYEKEEGKKDGRKWVKETWKGDNSYVVKTYIKRSNSKPSKKNIEQLKKEMESAIKDERFEDAAKIRDQIKELDK